MAVDLKQQLSSMPFDKLKELADSSHVDTTWCLTKEDVVDILIEKGVAPKPRSLEALLGDMKLKDLRTLAARHGVDVLHLRKKKEIAEALVTTPAAQAVYDEVRSQLEGAHAATAAPPRPAMDHAETDLLLYGSKNAEVDFGRAEDLLDQARMRFEERNFERAIIAADEAAQLTRANADGLQRSASAYMILSCQRLIEDCGKAGREVDDAADLLRLVKEAFRTNDLAAKPGLLSELEEVSRNLYTQEIQRARQEIYRVQDAIAHLSDTGASVARPEGILNGARDALRRNDHLLAIQLAAEAEKAAREALQAREREIDGSVPMTAAVINEARNVGADVSEAEKWLEKARVAVSDKDYVLAAELVKRSERAAMQSQHHQIEKAMELRRRQVEKAQQIIESVQPLVDEAEDLDIDVTEARTLVRQARDVLAKGDYVNGTVFAKNAAAAVRRLEPKLVEERTRRGIRKPEAGVCAACRSGRLTFRDDGWGQCMDCGRTFRWRRVPGSLWERFVNAIRD